ncbi:hypothetical protein VP06_26555, partial [Methylobacterium aquaticum]
MVRSLGHLRRSLLCATLAAGFATPALAQTITQAPPTQAPAAPAPARADDTVLRVCAATQPPLSLKDGTGLENRIASAVAEAMGR